MTPDQITDLMAQMIRVGFVNARQPEKMRVKVTVPDTTGAELVTDFLPVLCPRACEDMQYDLPDVGDKAQHNNTIFSNCEPEQIVLDCLLSYLRIFGQ